MNAANVKTAGKKLCFIIDCSLSNKLTKGSEDSGRLIKQADVFGATPGPLYKWLIHM